MSACILNDTGRASEARPQRNATRHCAWTSVCGFEPVGSVVPVPNARPTELHDRGFKNPRSCSGTLVSFIRKARGTRVDSVGGMSYTVRHYLFAMCVTESQRETVVWTDAGPLALMSRIGGRRVDETSGVSRESSTLLVLFGETLL